MEITALKDSEARAKTIGLTKVENLKKFESNQAKSISKFDEYKRDYSKTKKVGKKLLKNIGKKVLPKKLKNKKVFKEQKVTIVLNQPVYTQDKNRFFKDTWEEEKKQLFFGGGE